MHHAHISLFAILSLGVAILGAWTALDLFNRTRAHLGGARLRWLGMAALALGVGSWSMHCIAMLASYVALDLAQRVRTRDVALARAWWAGGSVALGVGIWSMHFIAMLGFDPGSPVSYDIGLTLLSFLLAVAGAGVAFLIAGMSGAGRLRLVLGSLAMGLAIVSLHYVGMAALRTAATLG